MDPEKTTYSVLLIFVNREVQSEIHLIKARMKACLVPTTARRLPQYLFLLLSRSATFKECTSIFILMWLTIHFFFFMQMPCKVFLTLRTLNSPRRQTRTVTRSPKMWSQRWRSSSTTSTFLRTRRQRSPLRPWTRPTPDSSSSSSSSCSCRSSASRNTLTHIHSRSSLSCTHTLHRHRPRPRLSSGNPPSATSPTHRPRPRSKSQKWWLNI